MKTIEITNLFLNNVMGVGIFISYHPLGLNTE